MMWSSTKWNLDKNDSIKKMDIIGSLPVEISQKVFLNLTPEDIRSALRCNTKWTKRMRGDYFWKEKCKINSFDDRKEFEISEFYDKFIEMYPNYWQSVYMYKAALLRNWKTNNYKESAFKCEKFTERCYYVDDEFVIIGSEDPPKILLYSYKLEKITKVFLSKSISELIKIIRSQNYLIYTDRERYLCVWDIEKEILLRSFSVSEDHHIVDIDVYKNLLGVIFGPDLLCIINLESWQTEHIPSNPSATFQYFANERVAFASDDHSMRLVNLQDKSVTGIECCENMEYHQIKFLDDHLVGLCGRTVPPFIKNFCVWKIGSSNNKLVHRIKNFQVKYKAFDVKRINRVIFLTNCNMKMEVWDFSRTGLHLFTIDNERNIWRVCLNDFCVIVCTNSLSQISRLNVIKIWCIETGKLINLLSMIGNVRFLKATNAKLVILDKCIITRNNILRVLDFEKFIKIN